MKNLILIILILLAGCSNITENNYQFQPTTCNPEPTPKFDGNKITILDNGKPVRDTIIGAIEKRRTVFKPCREMIYNTVFKEKGGQLITKSRIKMMAKGIRWKLQPEKQDEILIQYEFTQKDFDQNKLHQLNKSLKFDKWLGELSEGVIENVEEVWMHPFRFNQYNFTEVAPFPFIKLPLSIGKSWTKSLSIKEGWGDWENTYVNAEYKVVGKEAIKTDFGVIENCWKIESKSSFKLGKSTFEYWFNEELGFVKMNYKNYGNQTLQIVLAEVNNR